MKNELHRWAMDDERSSNGTNRHTDTDKKNTNKNYEQKSFNDNIEPIHGKFRSNDDHDDQKRRTGQKKAKWKLESYSESVCVCCERRKVSGKNETERERER